MADADGIDRIGSWRLTEVGQIDQGFPPFFPFPRVRA